MKSVKSKFIIKIVSVANLPDAGGFYRIEWKRSSTTGRTQTFVPTNTQKLDASPRSVRLASELVDEENLVFDVVTTQDASKQYSKKEMNFALKLKDGQKSKLLGTCDLNLSDYIPKEGSESNSAILELPFAQADREIILKLSIDVTLPTKKKGVDERSSSVSSSFSASSESEVSGDEELASPKKRGSSRRSGKRAPNAKPSGLVFVVEVCKITGLTASKFQPNAQFLVKCRSEHSTLGMTTAVGPLVSPSTEIVFDPVQEMTLSNVDFDRERVTFAIYSQLEKEKEKGSSREGKAEAFAKAKLTLSDYVANASTGNTSASSSTLQHSQPSGQPTRVVLTCATQKDTIEGILGRARSGSLSARKKEESPKEKESEIQLELNIKVTKKALRVSSSWSEDIRSGEEEEESVDAERDTKTQLPKATIDSNLPSTPLSSPLKGASAVEAEPSMSLEAHEGDGQAQASIVVANLSNSLKRNEELESEKLRLEKELKKKRQSQDFDVNILVAQKELFSMESERLKKEVEKLKRENDSLKKEVTKLKDVGIKAQKEISQLKDDNVRLRNQVGSHESLSTDLRSQEDLHALREKIRVKEECEEVCDELLELVMMATKPEFDDGVNVVAQNVASLISEKGIFGVSKLDQNGNGVDLPADIRNYNTLVQYLFVNVNRLYCSVDYDLPSLANWLNWLLSMLSMVAHFQSDFGKFSTLKDGIILQFKSLLEAPHFLKHHITFNVSEATFPSEFVRYLELYTSHVYILVVKWMWMKLNDLNLPELISNTGTDLDTQWNPLIYFLNTTWAICLEARLGQAVAHQIFEQFFYILNATVFNSVMEGERVTTKTGYAIKILISKLQQWASENTQRKYLISAISKQFAECVEAANVILVKKDVFRKEGNKFNSLFKLNISQLSKLLLLFKGDDVIDRSVLQVALNQLESEEVVLDMTKLVLGPK